MGSFLEKNISPSPRHSALSCDFIGQAAREYIAKYHSIEARVGQIQDLLLDWGMAYLPALASGLLSVPARAANSAF
jgi:hypothetical protein